MRTRVGNGPTGRPLDSPIPLERATGTGPIDEGFTYSVHFPYMLSREQTEKLRERLMGDRQRLLESAHSALAFTMDRDRDRVGRDSMDESTEEELYSIQLRLHDREKFLLGKIDAALERIRSGDIDECEDCEEPIGFERLLARPVTTLCIDCKSAREQNESD
jgi:DnaK suppressor protein